MAAAGGVNAPPARAYHTLVRSPLSAAGELDVLLYGGSAPADTPGAVGEVGGVEGAAVGAPSYGGGGEPSGVFHGDVWQLVGGGGAGGGGAGAGAGGVPASITWRRLLSADEIAAANGPPARAAHASAAHLHGECCALAGCMVVFGGMDARHRPLADLWQLCTHTRTWSSLLPAKGTVGAAGTVPEILHEILAWPGARHQHSLTALASSRAVDGRASVGDGGDASVGDGGDASVLLLYGGAALPSHSAAPPFADGHLWLYSLRTRTWLRLHQPAGSAAPAARLGHGALSIETGALWLYGGLEQPALGSDHGASWHYRLPQTAQLEAAIDACTDNGGCSAHGGCDLTIGRCICEPSWGGPACNDVLTAESADDEPDGTRRGIAAFLWFAAALLVGGAAGWFERHVRIQREQRQLARARAREHARLNPHDAP